MFIYLCILVGLIHVIFAQVIVLNSRNFDEKIKNGYWLIEFYAPWCNHCKQLEPILNQAVSTLDHFGVKVGKVDATVETTLRDRFNVTGFPTLYTINNGEITLYKGGRTLNSIIEYCSRNVRNPVRNIDHFQLESFIKAYNGVAFIFVKLDDTTLTKKIEKFYREAALQFFLLIDFGITSDQEVIKLYNNDHHQHYFLLKFINSKLSDSTSTPSSKDDFTTYIKQNQFPPVAKLNAQNIGDFINQDKLCLIAAVQPYETKQSRDLINLFQKLYKNNEFKNKFVFGHIDGVTWSSILTYFHVYETDLPKIIILDPKTNSFYEDPNVKTISQVEVFIDDVLNQRIAPEYLSWYGTPGRMYRLFKDNYPTSIFIVLGILFIIIIFIVIIIDGLCNSDDVYEDKKNTPDIEIESESEEESTNNNNTQQVRDKKTD